MGATGALGIRVIVGETTGFAHTADLSEERSVVRGPGGVRGSTGRWRRRPQDRAGRAKRWNTNM